MKHSILNLTPGFCPMPGQDLTYDFSYFPGGEINFQLLTSPYQRVTITCRVGSAEDLMKVLIANDALRRMGAKRVRLIIPCIPYARQDRICSHGEAFSLKVFANILNSAKFEQVVCWDAHSDVAPALINNCINRSNIDYVRECWDDLTKPPILISPDAGSNKKANALMRVLKFDSLVKCDKVRDVETGALSGFEVYANDLEGKACLIVDDICDGGGTFIGLAKELVKRNAGNLHLFVTHGIFSKGYAELGEWFNKIYTTNSIDNGTTAPFVTRYEITL